jgi:hypothetical protein
MDVHEPKRDRLRPDKLMVCYRLLGQLNPAVLGSFFFPENMPEPAVLGSQSTTILVNLHIDVKEGSRRI